jgi:lycopene cyclase domain-containing protein
MDLKQYTYFIILISSIAAPIALSFDKKVQYFRNLKYIFPSILITAIFFWIWDIRFTTNQVWSFNPEYVIGINILGMPIEEWLFFIVIPYCCIFIYEVLKVYLKDYEYPNFFRNLSWFLAVLFGLNGYLYNNQGYTLVTFSFSAVYLGYTILRNSFNSYFSKFYFAYFVSLIPFLIVNGILTSLPVVEYNSEQIMNIRIITIPVEDFSYLFLLLLMSITIYEAIKESKYY